MNTYQIQGAKYIKEGDKALKTGLFKWNKDFASAATNYDEALKMFQLAKDWDAVTKTAEKLISVNDKMNDPWAVAKNFEVIITTNLERNDGKRMNADALLERVQRAGYHFQLAKSYHRYISLVKKVAEYLQEIGKIADAQNLYKNLINELNEGEQGYERNECTLEYANLLLKADKVQDCLTLLEREMSLKRKESPDSNQDALALSIIALYLILNDIDKAEKRTEDFAVELKGFMKSAELDCADKLIRAYIDGSQEDFNKQLKRGVINSIFPVTIVKLLRKVQAKGCPDKKAQPIEDIVGPSQNNKPIIVKDEKDRKKALDDFC